MTRTVAFPRLNSLYRRAAVDAVRSKLIPTGSLRSMTVEPVQARHPGITAEQTEAYRRLFGGEAYDGVHRRGLPSVLVHIAGFPVQMALMSADGFPLPLMGLVHLRNTVEHHQPVLPGVPLEIVAGAENFRPHRRGTQVDITVEVRRAERAQDETSLLWSGMSTYLSRGTFIAGKPGAERAGSTSESSPSREFVPPVKTALWTLGADAGRQYAAVSGDYNPIHVSGLTAKALGMPAAIVHGMYCAARALEGREPDGAGHRWSISFEAPVTLPGRVAVAVEHLDPTSVEITGWNPKKKRRHFSAELAVPDH